MNDRQGEINVIEHPLATSCSIKKAKSKSCDCFLQGWVPAMDVIVNVTLYLGRLVPWTANVLLGWFFALVGLLPGFGGRNVILPYV